MGEGVNQVSVACYLTEAYKIYSNSTDLTANICIGFALKYVKNIYVI